MYMEATSPAVGSAQLAVTFEPGTNPDLAQVEVQNRLARAEPRLPEIIKRTGIRVVKATSNFLLVVTFNSDGNLTRDDIAAAMTGRLAAGVASVYGLILSIDVVRLHWPIAAELGYLNFGVWLIPAMFGIAYRRQLLTGRRAVGTAVALFAVDLALLRWGPYEPSMINFGNRYLSNTRPPSLLLAGHAIIMSALAIVAIPAINRWARRPRVWWMTVIGNSGVMTLYLWHIPALLGVQLLFDYFGHPRHPSQRDFVAVSAAQLLIMVIAVAVLFVLLQPLENKPLFGWDGAATITSAKRGAAA